MFTFHKIFCKRIDTIKFNSFRFKWNLFLPNDQEFLIYIGKKDKVIMIDFISLALYGHIVLNSKSEIGLVLKRAKVKKLCLLRCKQKKYEMNLSAWIHAIYLLCIYKKTENKVKNLKNLCNVLFWLFKRLNFLNLNFQKSVQTEVSFATVKSMHLGSEDWKKQKLSRQILLNSILG